MCRHCRGFAVYANELFDRRLDEIIQESNLRIGYCEACGESLSPASDLIEEAPARDEFEELV